MEINVLKNNTICPNCGSVEFMAHQLCRHDVVVTFAGNEPVFSEDKGIYDSEEPYGPYTCIHCGYEFDR